MKPALVAVALLLAAAPAALAQADRRDQLKSPGLVVDTGAPTGVTRHLEYTADGKFLFAAGEDKLVRLWPVKVDGTLDRDARATLRWRTWHEVRGAIYVAALSPDAKQKFVAVGGYAAVLGEVVVLDRATGKTVAALVKPKALMDDLSLTTTAVAFSPEADRVAFGTDAGGVFVWDFAKKDSPVTKIGTHGKRGDSPTNRVRHVSFADGGKLVSAAEDGRVLSWPLARPGLPAELTKTTVPNADVTAFCPKTQRLAFGGRDDAKANAVEVRSLDGKTSVVLALPADAMGRALVWSADGTALAVGVELSPADGKPHSRQPAEVWVCEVTGDAVTRKSAFPLDEFAGALAFSPDGKTLAVAGGTDSAVRLFDLKTKKEIDRVAGSGLTLWGVAFNADATAVGIRTKPNAAPTGYNDRAAGEWKGFDLKARKWVDKFTAVAPVETLGGWTVEAVTRLKWEVVNAGLGKRFALPFLPSQDVLPTCYSFVKGGNSEVHLAVGHKWGFSLFNVTGNGVARIRVGYGHGSLVTALAPSADGKLLLTAGRDQTINCFSLKEWSQQRELGASFVRDGAKLLVKEDAAVGSPAWEAGLAKGDEVLALAEANKDVEAANWPAVLAAPEPNKELFFTVQRRGVNDRLALFTSVRQRPLWKLFPMTGDEWVLWRWRDYFYDCSTNGDAAVGWQVNGASGDTPTYLKAEQMRKNRHKPEKVLEAVSVDFAPEKAFVFDLLPPTVTLTVGAPGAGDAVPVTVRVVPADPDAPARQPQSMSLWVNDHKFAAWAGGEVGAAGLEKTVNVPAAVLRSASPNVLVAHAYDRRAEASRGESAPAMIGGPAGRAAPKLHGLFVGVTNYTRASAGPKRMIGNLLFSVKDAQEMKEAWEAQTAAGRWATGRFALLANAAADPRAVVAELREIARAAAPDDLLVFHLSGHGWARPPAEASKYGREAFAFVGPKFDVRAYQETGLSSETLYDELAAIPCRKLLLIDACHSGGAVADGVRALTPDGIGPPILTAARPEELAFEHPEYGHSLFSQAMILALTDDFRAADANGDGRLDPDELAAYAARRVPELLAAVRPTLPEADRARTQQPQAYPPPFARPPVGVRPVAWPVAPK